ncbi:hypothetical protein [Streptomyces sp. 7N604]|uniref:hypothetical protein n=1 Tax=Streptomyces sp. 7N604 TaxID=3457415 RepID=UPI003FD4F8B5
MSDAQQPAGPRPEPLRFFGTTWVNHDGNYGLRRAGVAAGSLLAAAAGAFLLRFGYQGLAIAAVSGFVSVLVIVMFAACSALAFRRTWEGFTRRAEPGDASVERSMQSLRMVGFIGVLLAWFLRSLVEAPGEKLHRAEYERERTLYERRRATRAGNPAARAAATNSPSSSPSTKRRKRR